MFFLFRRKERTKEKSFAFGLSYEGFAGFGLFLEGLFLGEVLLLPFAAGAALEPAAFACFGRLAHLAAIIFCVSGFREWGLLAERLFTRAMFTAAAAQSILGGTCSRSTIY